MQAFLEPQMLPLLAADYAVDLFCLTDLVLRARSCFYTPSGCALMLCRTLTPGPSGDFFWSSRGLTRVGC
jgi:hypothetical protein